MTNGATWQFYAYTLTGEFLETLPYSISNVPGMLGDLDTILTACANMAHQFK